MQLSAVTVSPISDRTPLPVVVSPEERTMLLSDWFEEQKDTLRGLLADHGALLFRGFGGQRGAGQLETCIRASGSTLIPYIAGGAPREPLANQGDESRRFLYNASEFPPEMDLPVHNEMSYFTSWPLRVWFYCEQPARRGGQTVLADSRAILRRIPAELLGKFTRAGVKYDQVFAAPNRDDPWPIDWPSAFKTKDRGVVETYCRENGIECEWRPSGRLVIHHRAQATAIHPLTGESVWFNQGATYAFNYWGSALFGEHYKHYYRAGEMIDAWYGNGDEIEAGDIETVLRIMKEEAKTWDWQAGDLLLVDNMLVAHGRRPFTGKRKVYVALTDMHKLNL